MRKIKFTFVIAAFLTLGALGTFAQSPQAFKYQAVARDISGNVLQNQSISIRITILSGSPTGTPEYAETHSDTTNQFGLFNLDIGSGTLEFGNFNTINWGSSTHFVKIEMDPTGGTAYQLMGASQLLSVPYALHAKTAETVTETDPIYGSSVASGITGTDTTNWNNHTINTDTQLDSTGVAALGFVAGAHTIDTQLDSTGVASLGFVAGAHPTNVSSFTNDAGYLTQDTTLNEAEVDAFVANNGYLTAEVDGDSTNELQTLSISNDTIYLSNDGFVKLPADQTTDADADSTNEIQLLSFSNDTLYLSNGGYVVFPDLPNVSLASDDTLFKCGDKFVDMRDGKAYSTVLIGNQCWMAENLNIGTQIPPADTQTNNAQLEKYCHGGVNAANTEGDCSTWGGLYQWDEMMQYVTTPAAQGVCPTGWHIPTDAEWMTMEEALGMCSGGTNLCPGTACSGEICWRGTNQGDRLKRAYDCFGGQFCGISGFEALLAGFRNTNGLFYNSDVTTLFWSSTEIGVGAWRRYLSSGNAGVYRSTYDKLGGFSVRCLKD